MSIKLSILTRHLHHVLCAKNYPCHPKKRFIHLFKPNKVEVYFLNYWKNFEQEWQSPVIYSFHLKAGNVDKAKALQLEDRKSLTKSKVQRSSRTGIYVLKYSWQASYRKKTLNLAEKTTTS